jgi:hypothetical protein
MPNRFEDQPWYPEWKKTIDRVVTARMALDATTPGTPEWEAADRGEPPPIEKAHVHWPALGLENFLEACIYSRKIIANCQVPFSVRIGRLWQVRRGAVSQSLLQYLLFIRPKPAVRRRMDR